MYTYGRRVGPRVGSSQTFCRQSRVGSGRVGSTFRRVVSGRVQEKWPGRGQLCSQLDGGSHPRSAAGLLRFSRSWTVTIDLRAFMVSSPAAWNSLLVDLRYPDLSCLSFRKKLKTNTYFNSVIYLISSFPNFPVFKIHLDSRLILWSAKMGWSDK